LTAIPERLRHPLGKPNQVACPANRRQLRHQRTKFGGPFALRNRPPAPGPIIEVAELDMTARQGQRAEPGGDDALGVGLEPGFAGSGSERNLAFDAQPCVPERVMRCGLTKFTIICENNGLDTLS
jgi:hypothetical protein